MRALCLVQNGFYIDIGAQHPRIDSVSRAFYERGWRGIHIEPVAKYAELLREDRPDEFVLQTVVGDFIGKIDFYVIPESGLSTVSNVIAETHQNAGFKIIVEQVDSLTLASVFQQAGKKTIHWLKIDVEGHELAVLKGWKRHPARPWIIVIESTLPLTQEPSHAEWDILLTSRGYRFTYFDGLNRFYIHKSQLYLRDSFNHGPCVFDDFTLSGYASSPFCKTENRHSRNFKIGTNK